jgi:hypothetical protein
MARRGPLHWSCLMLEVLSNKGECVSEEECVKLAQKTDAVQPSTVNCHCWALFDESSVYDREKCASAQEVCGCDVSACIKQHRHVHCAEAI